MSEQIYYRGYDKRYGVFDSQDSSLYTWLTDDLDYAKEYANENPTYGGIAKVELLCDDDEIGSEFDIPEFYDYLDPGDEVFEEYILDKGLKGYVFLANQEESYCWCVLKDVCKVVGNIDINESMNRESIMDEEDLLNIEKGVLVYNEESLEEDTIKVKDHKWVNKGKEGTHGTFKTKKQADAQRKAMFANGYHEELDLVEERQVDIDAFNDKFGENSFDKFNKLKGRLKNNNISVDIVYHTKNTPKEDMDKILYDAENRVVKDETSDTKNNYKLVAENEYYRVLDILDWETSMNLGDGTGWCIAGRYQTGGEVKPSQAEHYFNEYLKNNLTNYLFFIPKKGDEKYCFCLTEDPMVFEFWNSDDDIEGDSEIPFNPHFPIFKYNGFEITSEDLEVLKIKDGVLVKCYDALIEHVAIPNSVTEIGDEAFSECYSLQSITIPNSVRYIGEFAFSKCESLQSITIPNSVTYIGYYAFYNCNNLTIKCEENSYAYEYAQKNGIKFELVSNINESLDENIEKHDTLNPKLWNEDNTLKEEVRDKILQIVDNFKEGLEEDGIKFEVQDVTLVGSNCSYNYTDKSDLDVHIIAKKLKMPNDLYPLLYSAYRSIWNKNHNVSFYGIPVELVVENGDEEIEDIEEALMNPPTSNGVYSVLNNKWIKEPSRDSIPEINQEEFEKLYNEWEDIYFDTIEKDDVEAIKDFIEDIYDLRKSSIARDGEYGVGNQVFKELRNLGYLDNIKQLKRDLVSKELSLEEKESGKKMVKENHSTKGAYNYYLRLFNHIKYDESKVIVKGGTIRESIVGDVEDNEKGGIIVLSTDVNAIKLSTNKIVNWVKQKIATIKNRVTYKGKIDKVSKTHDDMYVWTIGRFLNGRYKSNDGEVFDENSISIEIIGVTKDTLVDIAEDLCKEFMQESVLVKCYIDNTILFVDSTKN